jgi:GT2 family glycosyltransferase
MELSIAIVSYNTRELLLACLASIRQTSRDVRYELIVVDNASSDGSVEAVQARFPEARIIANADNGGYAKACNQAAAVAAGRHLLFLNSDTVMKAGTLRTMVDCLDREPTIGIVSCLQRNEGGRVLRSCFAFPSLRDHLQHAGWMPTLIAKLVGAPGEVDCTHSQDVDWANGACLMVRRDLFERVGGFDERFFMYFEDVDLCRRVHHQRYRVRHVADGEVVHLVGRSSINRREQMNVQWELSRIRYVEKHFARSRRLIMKGWIALGVLRKLIVTACSPGSDRRHRMKKMAATLRRMWVGHDERDPATVSPAGAGG